MDMGNCEIGDSAVLSLSVPRIFSGSALGAIRQPTRQLIDGSKSKLAAIGDPHCLSPAIPMLARDDQKYPLRFGGKTLSGFHLAMVTPGAHKPLTEVRSGISHCRNPLCHL